MFACALASMMWLAACDRNPDSTTSTADRSADASAAAQTSTDSHTADQRLASFFEEVFERDVSQSPEFQAEQGRKGEDYGKWDDYSEAWALREHEQVKGDLDRLRNEIDFDELSPQSRLSYRIFEYNQERSLRLFPWRHHQYAVSQMDNVAGRLPTFLQNIHRVDTLDDAQAYVSRLVAVETVMQQVVEQLRLGEEAGVIPPRMVYPRVLPTAEAMLKGAPFEETAEDGVVLADFRAKLGALDIGQPEQAILLNEAANALSGPFRRGYQAFIAEMTRLWDKSSHDDGVWALPNGDAYYADMVEYWTTVRRDPNEIHELGLAEVARIRGEMDAIRDQLGFEGDLQEFFEYIRNAPENYYPDTDAGRAEYIAEATRLIDGIYDIAPDYFNVLPKAPLEVRRVEPWREAGSSTAFYNRPAPDGSRPGIYYINQQTMNAVQKHIMNSLAYHEGAPGHHFQLAIQQELEGVPEFRKYAHYSAYSEGWALYSERLAWEAGLYEGLPMRDFGRLSEEMKRAVRLVVDTGMHARKWPLEKSIAYMTENTPMAPADVERQIKRYYVWPGQALSYKIGMLTILDLRTRARQALGNDFDIRAFHDVVLKNGAMPMAILEQEVDAYIAAVRAASG